MKKFSALKSVFVFHQKFLLANDKSFQKQTSEETFSHLVFISQSIELHTQTLAHFLGLSSSLEADERSIDRRSLCSFENDDDV